MNWSIFWQIFQIAILLFIFYSDMKVRQALEEEQLKNSALETEVAALKTTLRNKGF